MSCICSGNICELSSSVCLMVCNIRTINDLLEDSLMMDVCGR